MATQNRSSLLRFQLEGVEGPGEEIGRGSYAVVEEYDFQGLSCVGKTIHQELYDCASTRDRETMLERFEGESEMLSRLHHPHIVQFLGVHFNKGSPLPVLLMERLHSTLAACVDHYGKLPDECCYSVLRDVGVGLRYLHGHIPNPIVHRDLTANNVLLTPDLTAKISDLGVAKIINLNPTRMTQMTKCPGTPSYMPPEALIARPIYSSKMDIFAYGNLMTHVFCGQWPVPAEIFRANPSNPHDMAALTEVQRREEYLNDIGDTHPLIGLMRECLSNNPITRPNIPEILSRVKAVMLQFPPSFENKAEILQRIHADATDRASLSAQISNLRTQVEQKEDQLCTLSNENATLDDQRRDLWTQIEQKEDQLLELQEQIETVTKERFNISQLQQDREELAMRYEAQLLELQEQLETVTKERDSLLVNCERVTAQWAGRTRRLEQQLKAYQEGKTPAEQDQLELELETMRQKCDAWRQEGEKLLPLRNEMQQLQAHISEIEEQCERLRLDNNGLSKQLQSILEESERKQAEMTRQGTDYDILMQRFTELQQIRATLENELGPLREEREAILRENAALEDQLSEYMYMGAASDQSKAQLLELQEQLDAVMKERDSLLANRERVTAQWEGRIRRLEQQLKVYQEGKTPAEVDSMSGSQSAAFAELESQVAALRSEVAKKEKTERELMEMKDRNAALEEQLSEYMGAVRDQSKVIQGTMATSKAQDAEMLRAQQQQIHLTEYMKKQQLEYAEALSSFKKKMTSAEKFTEKNLRLHQRNVSLTGELEDYRTQTKLLLEDLRQKEEEIMRLKEEAPVRRPLESSDRDRLELELETMRQKCDAWRQEGEKLLPLRNEMQQLQAHISEIEEQCERLRLDNGGLGKQLQSILEESERKQAEMTRKGTDYDILMQRFTELQQIRATLENELGPLREEREAILRENATLAMQYEAQLLELREQLEAVMKERDSLLVNRERVTAQWEGRIRRLEQQLKAYQEGKTPAEVDPVFGSQSAAFAELESQVAALRSEVAKKEKTERELMEMKDRNAALEEQLSEYMGAVRDQSKVIQGTMATSKAQDAEMLRAQQQQIHLTEYMKKQQLEYAEALSSFKKKMTSAEKFTEENLRLHQRNVSLKGELEDYRTQTKLLLEDLRQKEEEIVRLKEEVAFGL